ncbi:UDP-N-acetylglucosamine 2-epimerase (non-hydrolyzing) [Tardiphaga sp.]|uniref:non-hydrolyzing UDP-N-acetylglucosamine 2-epimerase n=1 Tax=Tardiphaga sp. TaxID=1926292 RepID=UPI002632EC13|nr:UDP-N-acetylglucosamine 2-epimerase (non-hydrolyzing) [Tardiphaga sp.]MDB5618902.1 epsC [Tardiphaga sp.]
MKTLIVFGTRPEAIKMAPVVKELQKSAILQVRVCVTAQHRAILDQILQFFDITPDHDLNAMRPDQALDQLTARLLVGVGGVLDVEKPDLVLVHGDTTTTFASAISAFYRGIPIGHVEAGLRSGSLRAPFPEELNRKITSLVTTQHFVPTERSKENLLGEGVDLKNIYLTGNTVIDALLETAQRFRSTPALVEPFKARFAFLGDLQVILVTGHRRESFGEGFENICAAMIDIVTQNQNVQIVYPVHPNPNVFEPVNRLLGGHPRIHLIEPLDYSPFVYLMERSHFIITDSGGVQEEAPSLGKPVLVMRDTTERPEAVDAGTVILVGTSRARILLEANRLLRDNDHYLRMSRSINPYGDGNAAKRIRVAIEERN